MRLKASPALKGLKKVSDGEDLLYGGGVFQINGGALLEALSPQECTWITQLIATYGCNGSRQEAFHSKACIVCVE